MIRFIGMYLMIGAIIFIPVLWGASVLSAYLINNKNMLEKAVEEASDGVIHDAGKTVEEAFNTKEGRICMITGTLYGIILWPINMYKLIDYLIKVFKSINNQKKEWV